MKRIIILFLTIVSITSLAMAKVPTGKILYVDSDKAGKCYLTTINADGSNKTRLTPAYNNMMFPRISKKTGWIGFTNKTKDMKSEIYLLNKKGNKIRRVLTDAALECFSSDGEFFLFTTCNGKGELFVYSLKRKRAIKISQNLKVTSADWSPNKNWVVASVLENDGATNIYLISTVALGIIKVTDTPNINESFPSFSADGKFIAYFTNKSGSNEIEYYDLKKKEVQTPTITGMFPNISSDARWIVFQRGNSIRVARSDGLATKTICNGKTPIWVK